jgi:exopolysaccharide biosynthesis polyprenyl glycosylphosphotransferase
MLSMRAVAKTAAASAAVAIGWFAGLTGLGVVAELLLIGGLVVASGHDTGVPVRHRPVRVAVIGSATAMRALREELALAQVRRYVVVGRIEPALGPRPAAAPGDETLGALADLRSVIKRHRVDLLLMTDQPSRLDVFDELTQHGDDLRVRLWELSGFYEDVFGHIPLAVINSAWFQYVMHPKYRPTPPRLKRALDVSLGSALLLLTLPLLAVAALLVRHAGRPILYRQTRMGEGGRLFTMYKLCTMRQDHDQRPVWSSRSDPRVTSVGRFLRRSHIDELPQLINVIRGDMSLVGPRPEQPEFVAQLEQKLPFYSRRHAVKPGLTGWAQVHCGYAGSEDGSLWKLCHDLYYLKHRSMALDLRILWRTLRIPLMRDQYREPPVVPFVFRRGLEALEPPAAAVEMPAAAVEMPAAAVPVDAVADAGLTIATQDATAGAQPAASSGVCDSTADDLAPNATP